MQKTQNSCQKGNEIKRSAKRTEKVRTLIRVNLKEDFKNNRKEYTGLQVTTPLFLPHSFLQPHPETMNAAFREAAAQARQKPVKLTHNQEVRKC